MRSPILDALVGMLAFVSLAASAPAVSYGSPVPFCDPTTVFITSLSTVTEYESSTIYITLPCSSGIEQGTPTTALMLHSTQTTTYYPQIETVYLTTPGRASTSLLENAITTEAPQYIATITKTTVLVITNVQLTPYPAGGSLTFSETAASNGLLTFVVENGTTYWLNGQTPTTTESYVIQTSVVTVEPVPEASPVSDETTTSTVHLTRYSTQKFTIIETLSTSSHVTYPTQRVTIAKTTQSPTSTPSQYVGAGSTFTGIGAGGWNATSTARSGARTGDIGSSSTLPLVPFDPSQPITLATTFTLVSLSTLAAQSGFDAFSTSSAAGSSSTPVGAYTSFPVPPYANTTSSASISSNTGSASSNTSAFNTAVSSASSAILTGYSSTPSQVANSTTAKSLYSTGDQLSTAPSSSVSSQTSTSVLSTPSQVGNSTTIPSSYSTSVPLSTAPSSTLSSQTSTYVSSTASATPTICGEQGDFTLTFDDIPPLSVSDPNPNDVQPEPVFNPYHQFDFSDGWVVVPPPTAPYLPSSKPLFTEFIPNFNVNGTNPMAGPNTAEYGYSGDIGNGDHGFTGCFGFNVYGASFGCDSRGPPCDFSFTGFRLDKSTGNTTTVTSQRISIPACPALANCTLTPITLNNSFKDLDSIRINVTVANAPKIWWMDDLRLGWYDNSCKTGLCRISTPIH